MNTKEEKKIGNELILNCYMILCIGNPVYDTIITPYIKTDGRVLSGCSTNACLALAKLGEETTLVGSIGKDYEEKFLKDLRRYNIKSFVTSSPQTGGFTLIYPPEGERQLSVLGVADEITEIPENFLEADYVFFGSILQETSKQLFQETKKKSRAKLFLDPQGILRKINDGKILHECPPDIEEIVSLFDIVKPNEYEAEVITGINARKDAYSVVKKIHSWGCKIAIVTLAELGSVIYDGNKFYDIPAYPTKAIDSTGAGDTYAAGFIFESLRSDNLQEIGCFASAVASIMVENTGPDFPLSLTEVERRSETLTPRYDSYW
ncbi:MAG: PfkB family carbohydrate kinase [Candidatus Edwardsbacteria bacterium]